MGLDPVNQCQGCLVWLQARHHRYAKGKRTSPFSCSFVTYWTPSSQNATDESKGLHVGGSIINTASFVAKMGAATPQIACKLIF